MRRAPSWSQTRKRRKAVLVSAWKTPALQHWRLIKGKFDHTKNHTQTTHVTPSQDNELIFEPKCPLNFLTLLVYFKNHRSEFVYCGVHTLSSHCVTNENLSQITTPGSLTQYCSIYTSRCFVKLTPESCGNRAY